MIWNVQTSRDVFNTVKADIVRIEDGCLVFYDRIGLQDHLVLAMAYDQWVTVHSDDDGRAALKREAEEALTFRKPSFDYQSETNRPEWVQSTLEGERDDGEIRADQKRGRVRRVWHWLGG